MQQPPGYEACKALLLMGAKSVPPRAQSSDVIHTHVHVPLHPCVIFGQSDLYTSHPTFQILQSLDWMSMLIEDAAAEQQSEWAKE